MSINRISIDVGPETLEFDNQNILSIYETTAVSMIGDELAVDQFVPVVRYRVYFRYQLKTSDDRQLITKSGLTLCTRSNYNIRLIPYGSKVTFYSDNNIFGIYYVESVNRVGNDQYELKCISAIGLMDRQPHRGGLYTGQTFSWILSDILGDQYEYIVADDVAKLPVYGWLPYSSRRANLHQLLLAYGVNVIKSTMGTMLFTFILDSPPEEIIKSKTYNEGSVDYGSPASRVEVTEHIYYYLPTAETETFYDNTETETAENELIIFKQPVYVPSLETTGVLEVVEAGVNYAIVSGAGTLKGKAYIHNTKIISADNPAAATENVKKAPDLTLSTLITSENITARLAQYYFNSTILSSNIVVGNERCGKRYAIYNAFGDYATGYMAKMSTYVSNIKKASCELIADYIPKSFGSAYTNVEILADSDGIWVIPDIVFQKEEPNIRVICIGAGQDGGSGRSGEKGADGQATTPGNGGAGGLGGAGGSGGKIYIETINCAGIKEFTYKFHEKSSYFFGGGKTLSSDNGATSESGFLEIFSGTIYALPGKPGQNGAPGGKGGRYPHNSTATSPTDGKNVSYNEITYKGGAGGGLYKIKSGEFEAIHENLEIYIGGGGGGGAAVGNNGGRGAALYDVDSPGKLNPGGGGIGGDGANGDPALSVYGSGGNGGHGGGGGGGAGCSEYWNWVYNTIIAQVGQHGGKGGKGGAGSSGMIGCIIIYY